MKRILLLTAVLLVALHTTAQVSIKNATSGKYSPQYVYGVNPMQDGETYTQLSSDRKRIVRTSFKTGKEVAVLFDVDKARGDANIKSIDGYIMSPDESRILLQTETEYVYRRTHKANYYVYSVQNNRYEPLSEGGKQMSPLFSPDGNVIAFARDNNLFVCKLLYGNAETQVTKDGERNKIINGIPDWVNEEEFTTERSFDFTADSEMLCWIRYDESEVPVFDFTEFETDKYPHSYTYKYPTAGEANAKICVMSYDIKNRNTKTLNVPLDADGYIPRIAGTSDATKLCVITLNRHQSRMDVYMVNPRSTEAKLVLREENDKYLRESAYTAMKFYDGHFSLLSERTGYQHLYWYTLNGTLEQTVTSGNYEVTNFYGYNPQTGKFYYQSCEESPLRRAIYTTDRKGKKTKLSQQVGSNAATFATSYKYFLNVYSNLTTPPITTLCDANGKTLQTLVDNASLKQTADADFGQKELFTFTTSEGITLNGWMLRPRNFDASRKYPVVMYQYSGPGSQEVSDSWNNGFYPGGSFESILADEGFISVIVDGRGTGYRGAEFEKCTYLRLGQLESRDQVEAALWLAKQPYVDASRIGIWGWSFGGFNTLMSLGDTSLGQQPFRAGVAVAAPSNWKFYDTVYTERYMRTPQENGEGYETCPISRVNDINASLLLIHGTADDNVHFRNFTEMSEALVQADKQFDQQVYRNRNHFIYGGNTRKHIMTRIVNFFKREMR